MAVFFPPMATNPSLLVAAVCLLLPVFLWLRKSKSAPVPLPPGPKPVPLLGNIRHLRPQELWLSANDWAKQYGNSILPLSYAIYSTSPQAMSFISISSA